jgi:hypothetical protein
VVPDPSDKEQQLDRLGRHAVKLEHLLVAGGKQIGKRVKFAQQRPCQGLTGSCAGRQRQNPLQGTGRRQI